MNIISPGSVVKLWGGVEAFVIGAYVTDTLEYKVAYWSGTKMEEQYIPESMVVSVNPDDCETIGLTDRIEKL
jgi:hypothetical protein